MNTEEQKGFRWQSWEYLKDASRAGGKASKMLTARAVVCARGYKSHRAHINTVYAHLRNAGCVYNPVNGCWEVSRVHVEDFMRTVEYPEDWQQTEGSLWFDGHKMVVPIREAYHDYHT